ncbi:hypothetical protein E1A91_A12G198300v1 [Gossypium mustelinum]|uniref:Uncharacterized protein n=3 Tax=Gossypium TaxID=3633 RepID=A0A5J5TGG3_GOSBA|nr:hypothetical protein ES319_A12G193100v1 [Gossypium barbadense]TYG90790.1 hypothetical protein ES288_A12G210600v1 [Gossypium darwinii]TYJ05943.1 hypothetical protein E1A91_A12G198300v1 [Gossypium mustelinum]
MRLNESDLLREYTGQRYEIETPMTSWVGKIPEYPHPVAPSISSRVMVELGMVTAVITTAAALVVGFLAAAAFVVTSFKFKCIKLHIKLHIELMFMY